jgi:rod shape-determining protein MreB and related proteins
MLFNWILGLVSSDLAIDLGTSTTLVYVNGKGIVICEPSVVAVRADETGTKRILAVGNEAKRMIGRTNPLVEAIRPIRAGVISDFDVTEVLLRRFILQAHQRRGLVRPRIIICVPYRATDVERRAIRESAFSAGAREVYLIEEPLAAAIGAGLPISEPNGNLVLDIGGGNTEVAVISLSGIVYTHHVNAAGDTLNESILHYIKRKYNLLVGENTAEAIKIHLGSAWRTTEPRTMEVKGRDMIAGLPRRIFLRSEEVREAIQETVDQIVDAVKVTLERTPPELTVDIMERGITLTGGGALLTGLDMRLQHETGLPVHIAKDPVACVVLGSGKALQELPLLKRVALEN